MKESIATVYAHAIYLWAEFLVFTIHFTTCHVMMQKQFQYYAMYTASQPIFTGYILRPYSFHSVSHLQLYKTVILDFSN